MLEDRVFHDAWSLPHRLEQLQHIITWIYFLTKAVLLSKLAETANGRGSLAVGGMGLTDNAGRPDLCRSSSACPMPAGTHHSDQFGKLCAMAVEERTKKSC